MMVFYYFYQNIISFTVSFVIKNLQAYNFYFNGHKECLKIFFSLFWYSFGIFLLFLLFKII